MQSFDRIPAGERDEDLHEVSGREARSGYPPGNQTAGGIATRCASCATSDAWHNWHNANRYAEVAEHFSAGRGRARKGSRRWHLRHLRRDKSSDCSVARCSELSRKGGVAAGDLKPVKRARNNVKLGGYPC
jgi:hypothetical protein